MVQVFLINSKALKRKSDIASTIILTKLVTLPLQIYSNRWMNPCVNSSMSSYGTVKQNLCMSQTEATAMDLHNLEDLYRPCRTRLRNLYINCVICEVRKKSFRLSRSRNEKEFIVLLLQSLKCKTLILWSSINTPASHYHRNVALFDVSESSISNTVLKTIMKGKKPVLFSTNRRTLCT